MNMKERFFWALVGIGLLFGLVASSGCTKDSVTPPTEPAVVVIPAPVATPTPAPEEGNQGDNGGQEDASSRLED